MSDHSRSLSQRLALWLAVQTFVGLAITSTVVYVTTSKHLISRQKEAVAEKQSLVHHLIAEARDTIDTSELHHKLDDFLIGHYELSLVITDANNNILYASENIQSDSNFVYSVEFPIQPIGGSSEVTKAVLTFDARGDAELLRHLALTLAVVSILGTLVVSCGALWLVKKGLQPVDDLAAQTSALTASSLSSRLDGSAQPKELQPLVVQFNQLLERLSASYYQLENFNADVAHELNTPLTTLTMSTELALRSSQNEEMLHELLGSNLEEFHRMSSIVKDMLFLSQAERGGRARRVPVKSLAVLVEDVIDYHEASFSDANLDVVVNGDASGQLDVPLIKRALSNLLGNAAAYADPGSVVSVSIECSSSDELSIIVQNFGKTIPEAELNRLFDRFYRADTSRTQANQHHGLGLSIVAGIARMHGGQPYAQSSGNTIRIGFSLPLADNTLNDSDGNVGHVANRTMTAARLMNFL
jgi:two-component system heavy metal sensor histidine kinase CusS